MAEIYNLEKSLWTDEDFNAMNWHDNSIHAICFDEDSKLILDIDYIFKWVLSKDKKHYKFWIAPCTLIFEFVHEIELQSSWTQLIIDNITRENPKQLNQSEQLKYDWIIETTVGELSFKSTGFKQYVRQQPKLVSAQQLSLEMRGGISFSIS